jgi:hypothetical protein
VISETATTEAVLMFDPDEPIKLDEYRRLRAGRTAQASLRQASPEGHSDGSRFGLAVASVVDQRRWHDWAWLDQDRALHQP